MKTITTHLSKLSAGLALLSAALFSTGCQTAPKLHPIDTMEVGETKLIYELGSGQLPGVTYRGIASLNPEIVSVNGYDWDLNGEPVTKFYATAVAPGTAELVFVKQQYVLPEKATDLHPSVRTEILADIEDYDAARLASIEEAKLDREPIRLKVEAN